MNQTLDPAALQMVQDGETDIVVRRDFSHPPERVWRALTQPDLIRKWMAPGALIRCEMDARTGGSFHYAWGDENGTEFFFSGPVLEADAPRRMVHVEHFNGDTSSGPTITTELVPRGAGTRMTMVMRYRDSAERAAAVEMGMTDGYDEVYGRLADLEIG